SAWVPTIGAPQIAPVLRNLGWGNPAVGSVGWSAPQGEVLFVVLISAHADGPGGNPALVCCWKVRSDTNQENRICAGRGYSSDIPGKFRIACGTQRHRAGSQDRLRVCAGIANQ